MISKLHFRSLALVVISTLAFSSASTPLQSEHLLTRGFAGRDDHETTENGHSFVLPSPRYRLNNTFIPESYEIELFIVLDQDPEVGEQFTAPGKVKIIASPTANTERITLHAYLLLIDYDTLKVSKVSDPSLQIGVTGWSNDTESRRHFLSIDVNTTLETGESYLLEMTYVAPISTDKRNGLYLSTDLDPITGEERRQAATQMESFYARELFPCFDEPELKAKFDVTLIRINNYTALANGELVSSTPHPLFPGWTIDVFNTTVPMPTYLFAIFVSHFTFAEVAVNTPTGDVFIRVHGPPEMVAIGGGNYTVQATADVFKAFNEYYDTPNYSFKKMDSVAVPMKGGAMENWALILYRYDLLMYFNGETTERKRYAITDVIAHEVAHQNFGNLVTCKWWSVLWLNEGFATYNSHLGVNLTYPEFQPFDLFVNNILQYSMVFDATNATHPLQNDAETPEEIDSIFSRVTYEKGGSIIRMMTHFLTESTVQKGLRYYLKEMEYKPVEQEDLYRNLQMAVDEHGSSPLPDGLTVKDVLDTWTLQSGFPLVKVSVLDATSVEVSQERFGPGTSDLWYVPITLAVGNGKSAKRLPDFWLGKNESTTTLQLDTTNWVVLNIDAIGYYRVQYDNALLNLIQEQLANDPSVIPPLTRSQLVDDYFTFAFDERIPIETAMELTEYLREEDHFTVWNALFTHLLRPKEIFRFRALNRHFENYFLPRVESALLKVGVEQSAEHVGAVSMFRERLLDWACSMNSTVCVDYADYLLSEWRRNPYVNPINVDIRPTMQCAIAALDGASFDFILEQFNDAIYAPTRLSLLNSLACGAETQMSKLDELFNRFLSGSPEMSRVEAAALFQTLSADTWGSNVAFNLLTNRLPEVLNIIFGGSVDPIADAMTAMLKYVSDVNIRDYMITWFNDNAITFNPIRPRLDAAIEGINDNIRWMQKFGEAIEYFLENNSIHVH